MTKPDAAGSRPPLPDGGPVSVRATIAPAGEPPRGVDGGIHTGDATVASADPEAGSGLTQSSDPGSFPEAA